MKKFDLEKLSEELKSVSLNNIPLQETNHAKRQLKGGSGYGSWLDSVICIGGGGGGGWGGSGWDDGDSIGIGFGGSGAGDSGGGENPNPNPNPVTPNGIVGMGFNELKDKIKNGDYSAEVTEKLNTIIAYIEKKTKVSVMEKKDNGNDIYDGEVLKIKDKGYIIRIEKNEKFDFNAMLAHELLHIYQTEIKGTDKASLADEVESYQLQHDMIWKELSAKRNLWGHAEVNYKVTAVDVLFYGEGKYDHLRPQLQPGGNNVGAPADSASVNERSF